MDEEEPEVEIIELPINRDVVTMESGVVQRYGARLVDRHWRMEERVEATVVEIVRDQLNRRQQGQGTGRAKSDPVSDTRPLLETEPRTHSLGIAAKA